jgi:hypothetical protein
MNNEKKITKNFKFIAHPNPYHCLIRLCIWSLRPYPFPNSDRRLIQTDSLCLLYHFVPLNMRAAAEADEALNRSAHKPSVLLSFCVIANAPMRSSSAHALTAVRIDFTSRFVSSFLVRVCSFVLSAVLPVPVRSIDPLYFLFVHMTPPSLPIHNLSVTSRFTPSHALIRLCDRCAFGLRFGVPLTLRTR